MYMYAFLYMYVILLLICSCIMSRNYVSSTWPGWRPMPASWRLASWVDQRTTWRKCRCIWAPPTDREPPKYNGGKVKEICEFSIYRCRSELLLRSYYDMIIIKHMYMYILSIKALYEPKKKMLHVHVGIALAVHVPYTTAWRKPPAAAVRGHQSPLPRRRHSDGWSEQRNLQHVCPQSISCASCQLAPGRREGGRKRGGEGGREESSLVPRPLPHFQHTTLKSWDEVLKRKCLQ